MKAESLLRPPPSVKSPLRSIWESKSKVIAGISVISILSYLGLRYALRASESIYDAPLLIALVLGGVPQLYELLVKLIHREFGSDLLGGISVVTSVLLGEYLAGTIIVLMLSGGEALETYALRSASSVLAALAKRLPS